jgi:FMN-dependent NADH-azoreductase
MKKLKNIFIKNISSYLSPISNKYLSKMPKGACMYYSPNNDCYCLMLYVKLQRRELKRLLPLIYKFFGGDHYKVVFINGVDFIGQDDYESICEFTKLDDVVNILDTTYYDAKKVLKDLTEEEFDNNVKFSIEQLNNDYIDEYYDNDDTPILTKIYNFFYDIVVCS